MILAEMTIEAMAAYLWPETTVIDRRRRTGVRVSSGMPGIPERMTYTIRYRQNGELVDIPININVQDDTAYRLVG